MVKSFPLPFRLCLFIFLLFASCARKPGPTIAPITPMGAVLPFEIIEKEDYLPGAPPEVDYKDVPMGYPGGTSVFILTKKEDIQQVESHISTSSKETLYELDFKQSFAIVLFHGSEPSTGYGAEIQDIRKADHQINIFTAFFSPTPDIPVGLMETSPFEVITLKKDDLRGEYEFNLIVEGKKKLKTTATFP